MTNSMYYILDKEKNLIESDTIGYQAQQSNEFHKWIVGLTRIDSVKVSTVFLGLNHNYGEGDPILFETLIFGGDYDQDMERYCTWAEAEKAHQRIVHNLLNGMRPDFGVEETE